MEIELFNNKLKVFECGKVLVLGKYKPRKGEYYEMKYFINNKGYKILKLNHEGKRKPYFIHRIIAYAYLGLDINNPIQVIDHIDRNILNNCVSNLRIVSQQENCFNTNAKGYHKRGNKYHAQIKINEKRIHLGMFDTEAEASNAYQQAKLIHHVIN
jgi:hypothetical protein